MGVDGDAPNSSSTPKWRRRRLLLLAAAAAAVLSSCSNASSSAVSTSSTVATGGHGAVTTIPEQHPLPSAIPNNPRLRHSITITGCSAIPGGWKASGTAVNTGSAPISYKITIFFTTPHSTVIDYADTSVTVAPGKKGTWTAQQKFATVPGMICALRGVSS